MESRAGFVGLSHLGIVSSIGWASFGDPVSAIDLDPEPVAQLARGFLPIHEPSLDDLFAQTRNLMTFSTDPALLEDCDPVIVARDLPTDDENVSDHTVVSRLIEWSLPALKPGVTLLLMSQVPPGFTRRLAGKIRESRPDLGARLYYWVETLVFGRAVERYLRPERIILGCEEPSAPLPPILDAALSRFGCPILPMSYESAELAKTAINLYLCAAVTYANTLSNLCEALHADWWEIMPALRLDARIGPSAYIRPGLGIAGGNLERDLVALRDLCRSKGVDPSFIETIIDSNARRHEWAHDRLREELFGEVSHPVIAVWGLAYKKNTRSMKNSMALRVLRDLAGRAELRAYDPLVTASEIDAPVKVVGDRDEALVGADCLLIMTDWDEFSLLRREPLRMMKRRLVIDCVGVVDAALSDLTDVRYLSMGRGGRP